MPRRWWVLALAVSLLAPLARGADRPLAGSKLLVQDPTGSPLRRQIGVKAGDAVDTGGLAGNPALNGGALHIVTRGGTPTDQTFELPASGWKAIGLAGFFYSNAVPGGAVKSVLLKRNARGAVSLKMSVRGSAGPVEIVPPNPGDAATIVLALAGGDTFCASFGGPAGGVERRDDTQVWLVSKSAAVACPGTSTTTTTATTSTTTSSDTSTTTTSTSSSTTTVSTTSTSSSSTTTSSSITTTSTTGTTTSTTTTTTATTTTTTPVTTTSTIVTSSSTTMTTSTTTSTTTGTILSTTSTIVSTTSTTPSTATATTSTTTTTASTTTTAPCNPDSESYSEPAFYRSLAYRWAPIILQDTASKWNADFIGRVDYDNDWRGNDNWQNLPSNGIAPYLYYDVLETSTHWFIGYHTFHPRDWDDVFFGTCGPFSDCHENDTENLFMMIQKDGSTYGRFRLMETEAHTSFYQYALANDGVGNGTGPDADDIDDDAERGFSLFVDSSVGVNDPRPAIYIESKGHGICDWWDNNGPYCVHPDDKVGSSGNDGVMYYPSATAVPTVPPNPSGGQWYDFKYPYQLISLWDDVWVLRSCLGDGKSFDQPFTYPGVSGNASPYIGGAMDGDDYAADAGTAWWAQAHGNLAPGDWTMDPARTVLRQLTFAETVDRNYTFNPFFGIR